MEKKVIPVSGPSEMSVTNFGEAKEDLPQNPPELPKSTGLHRENSAKRMMGGIMSGASTVVGGVTGGAKALTGGITDMGKSVTGGITDGVKNVTGGVTDGAMKGLNMGANLGKMGASTALHGATAGFAMGMGVSRAVLPHKVPDSPEAIEEMLDKFDVDGDGVFSRHEVTMMATFMLKEQKKVQQMKLLILIIVGLIIAGGCALYGIVIGANETTKDTRPDTDGILKTTAYAGTKSVPIAVDNVKSYARVIDLPQLPTDTLRAVNHLTLQDKSGHTHFHQIVGFTKYAEVATTNAMDLFTPSGFTIEIRASAVDIVLPSSGQRTQIDLDASVSRRLLDKSGKAIRTLRTYSPREIKDAMATHGRKLADGTEADNMVETQTPPGTETTIPDVEFDAAAAAATESAFKTSDKDGNKATGELDFSGIDAAAMEGAKDELAAAIFNSLGLPCDSYGMESGCSPSDVIHFPSMQDTMILGTYNDLFDPADLAFCNKHQSCHNGVHEFCDYNESKDKGACAACPATCADLNAPNSFALADCYLNCEPGSLTTATPEVGTGSGSGSGAPPPNSMDFCTTYDGGFSDCFPCPSTGQTCKDINAAPTHEDLSACLAQCESKPVPAEPVRRRLLDLKDHSRHLRETRIPRMLRRLTANGRPAIARTRHLRNSKSRTHNSRRLSHGAGSGSGAAGAGATMSSVPVPQPMPPTPGVVVSYELDVPDPSLKTTIKKATSQARVAQAQGSDQSITALFVNNMQTMTAARALNTAAIDYNALSANVLPLGDKCDGFETIAMVEIDGVTPQDFGYIADNIMDSYAMPLGIDMKNVEIGDVEMVATGLSVVLKLKTCTVPERDELEMKVYDILAQNSEAAAAANTVAMDGSIIPPQPSAFETELLATLAQDATLPAHLMTMLSSITAQPLAMLEATEFADALAAATASGGGGDATFDDVASDIISTMEAEIPCPTDMPMKCWDNSCAIAVEGCPCPPETPSKCDNGACVFAPADCPEFCPPETPAKCVDGACMVAAADCPENQACPPEMPAKCADGTCMVAAADCPENQACPPATPEKCSDGTCAMSASECPCPVGMMARCWDDTCAVSEADCPCPPWMPAKCDDGTCMMSASECPCPMTTPMKCWDDTCAISHADCPCPPEMPAKCADGMCMYTDDQCPENQVKDACLETGCPYRVWLGDGYCDESCNNAACRFDGGDCMVTAVDQSCLDTGCPYTVWIGDGYCDDSCNNDKCSFDGGDCDGYNDYGYYNTAAGGGTDTGATADGNTAAGGNAGTGATADGNTAAGGDAGTGATADGNNGDAGTGATADGNNGDAGTGATADGNTAAGSDAGTGATADGNTAAGGDAGTGATTEGNTAAGGDAGTGATADGNTAAGSDAGTDATADGNTAAAHPCDDASHGCDQNGGGICYEQNAYDWACGCASGYYCASGCMKPHSGHECVAITSAPTPAPGDDAGTGADG